MCLTDWRYAGAAGVSNRGKVLGCFNIDELLGER